MVCDYLSTEEVNKIWQIFLDWVACSPACDTIEGQLILGSTCAARHWWDVQVEEAEPSSSLLVWTSGRGARFKQRVVDGKTEGKVAWLLLRIRIVVDAGVSARR